MVGEEPHDPRLRLLCERGVCCGAVDDGRRSVGGTDEEKEEEDAMVDASMSEARDAWLNIVFCRPGAVWAVVCQGLEG